MVDNLKKCDIKTDLHSKTFSEVIVTKLRLHEASKPASEVSR